MVNTYVRAIGVVPVRPESPTDWSKPVSSRIKKDRGPPQADCRSAAPA
jgi:hypothetical protein